MKFIFCSRYLSYVREKIGLFVIGGDTLQSVLQLCKVDGRSLFIGRNTVPSVLQLYREEGRSLFIGRNTVPSVLQICRVVGRYVFYR